MAKSRPGFVRVVHKDLPNNPPGEVAISQLDRHVDKGWSVVPDFVPHPDDVNHPVLLKHWTPPAADEPAAAAADAPEPPAAPTSTPRPQRGATPTTSPAEGATEKKEG